MVAGINDICKMHTWIDASHAVHPNVRGHTGKAYAFITGIFSAMSSKQNLNTASSTECKVAGNSNFITKPISF